MTTAMTAFEGTPAQIELVKNTICRGATNDELAMFLYTAKRTGLDPLLRQIHAVKRWDKKLNRETMAIQTGIDGLRLIADRTGLYAGNDEAVFEYLADNPAGLPVKASVTVYKIVGGQRCAFTASARWAEYCPKAGNDFMWLKMPHVMIGKCAEALALRKAFPAEIAGLYTHEEMAQAGEETRTTAMDTPRMPRPKSEPALPATETEKPENSPITVKESAEAILGATEVVQEAEERPIPAGYKLMKAKYDGLCKGCGQVVKSGSDVIFSSKFGVRHPDCS